MKRICKYNQNNLYNYRYNYSNCNSKWKNIYYRLYGVGNTLNCLSKIYNIKQIVCGINGLKK